jgi:hypothetical protein
VSANRDTVVGFEAGAGGDIIQLENLSTSNANAGVASVQQVASRPGSVTFVAASNDIIEFSFDLEGTGLAGDNTGGAFLLAIGSLNTVFAGTTGYAVAYQDGNAYLYHFNSGTGGIGGTQVNDSEMNLIGVFNGVGVGALEASNFLMV